MAISHLYPTQRPALDLNFARQKRLDSRVTFTRGSTATYVGSDGLIKPAASGEARFDHDPETGESLGLLVETSSTNSHTRSEAYTSWDLSLDVNVSYGTGGPSPTGSGQFVTLTTTSATNTIRQSGPGSFALPVDGYACYSLYIDAQNSSSGTMFIALGSAGSNYTRGIVTINADKTISTGTQWVGHDRYTPVAHGYYYLGRGIYRVWYVTQNQDTSAYTGYAGGLYPAANLPLGYTFHWWGFQCEPDRAYPSSYIPTDGSTVTRSADVASMTGANFSSWYNSSEGTWVAGLPIPAKQSSSRVFTAGTEIWADPTPRITAVRTGSSTNYISVTHPVIAAAAYNSSTCFGAAGGLLSGNVGGTLTTPTQMIIGRSTAAGVGYINVPISRLTYYPTRLSNDQLQALTL